MATLSPWYIMCPICVLSSLTLQSAPGLNIFQMGYLTVAENLPAYLSPWVPTTQGIQIIFAYIFPSSPALFCFKFPCLLPFLMLPDMSVLVSFQGFVPLLLRLCCPSSLLGFGGGGLNLASPWGALSNLSVESPSCHSGNCNQPEHQVYCRLSAASLGINSHPSRQQLLLIFIT